ncbi:MAG: hypothetical protein HYU66_07655, partial [Armatimonadetes bacterium]|nr:hypothetical protein [Armatimonadota bacterium]
MAYFAVAYWLLPRPRSEVTFYLVWGPLWLLLMGPIAEVFSGRSERMAIWVGRRGLTETYRTRRERLYPWECVQSVELGQGSARVVTSRADIEIHSEVQDWGQLVELVRDRIGQAPDDAGKRPTIEREGLAEWLG